MLGLPWLQSYLAVSAASRFQNPIFIMGVMAIVSRILLKESPAALGLFLASALVGAWTVPEPEENIAHVAAHAFIVYVVGAYLEFSWWITGLLLASTDFVIFITYSENLPRKFALLVPGFIYTAHIAYGGTRGICAFISRIYNVWYPDYYLNSLEIPWFISGVGWHTGNPVVVESEKEQGETNLIIVLCYLMVVTGILLKMVLGRRGTAVAVANDENEKRDGEDCEDERNQG